MTIIIVPRHVFVLRLGLYETNKKLSTNSWNQIRELKLVDTNLNYYNQNAKLFSESTLEVDMTGIYNSFLPLVEANGHILDAGCGSGRDSMYFSKLRLNIMGIDQCGNEIDYLNKKYW